MGGLVYLVGDAGPGPSDAVGGFGDGLLDNLDLIDALRFFGVVANRSADGAPVIIEAPGIGSLEPPREM
jgi:hypothetical protein